MLPTKKTDRNEEQKIYFVAVSALSIEFITER